MKVYEPEINRDEHIGIVLVNHLGSMATSDSGRDAEQLTKDFGLITIAADRPGSGLDYRRGLKSSLGADHIIEYRLQARNVAHELDQLGVSRVLLTGRSAGGSGAFTFARTETLPLGSISVFEPIGWGKMPLADGRKRYWDYIRNQKNLQDEWMEHSHPDNQDLALPQAIARFALMGPALLNDYWHNTQLWADGQANKDASVIAESMPNVPTAITLAERSLAVTDAERELLDVLPVIREDSDPLAKPFQIRTVEKTVHRSFDNRAFIAELLRPDIEAMARVSG